VVNASKPRVGAKEVTITPTERTRVKEAKIDSSGEFTSPSLGEDDHSVRPKTPDLSSLRLKKAIRIKSKEIEYIETKLKILRSRVAEEMAINPVKQHSVKFLN
jgi:hypothetical protein